VPGSISLLAFLFASTGAADEPLPSGWAARFRCGLQGSSDVTTHAEHAAFALHEGETPHPNAAAEGLVALFDGELRIRSKGRYRFRLDVEGGLALLDVGLPNGSSAGIHMRGNPPMEPTTTRSEWIELAPGTVPVTVGFVRAGSAAARLRTSWEMERSAGGEGFADEPIPTSAVRVPADAASEVRHEMLARRGRVLLGELGCVSCHDPGAAGAAVLRRAPIPLERAAARASERWLRNWIAAPQANRPGCGMPDLLDPKSPEGKAEVEGLVQLLGSLAFPAGAPATAAEVADPLLAARGREIYHSVGCVGCHGPLESAAAAFGEESLERELPALEPPASFGHLDGKWRVVELAAFLRDPLAARPDGRMPSLDLSEAEAAAVAHYLVGRFGSVAAAEPFLPDPTLLELGRRAFVAHRCSSCHTIGAGGEALDLAGKTAAPLHVLGHDRGCLSTEGRTRGSTPIYAVDAKTRAALVAGLHSARRIAGLETLAKARPAAPIDRAQLALAAFGCAACHERDGAPMAEGLRPYFRCKVETDLGDEGRLPPRLDGVGSRLQTPWLARVIGSGERARPYLASRMPKFGEEVAALLVDGLAAIEGEWRSDDPRAHTNVAAPEPPHGSEELAVVGRALAGSGGLNCITCHSFGDRPSAGTPGLDFAQFSRRIRKEWWRSYARSPLRFKPGTRMPTYFEEERSAARSLLDGDSVAQIDALWAWFERASTMPAPEGVPTGRRMVLDVGDRPKVFRTFLARAGNRGIAVGFPAGLHFAFDAEQVRLCEAWSGEFLDVAPVWTGRGGNVAPQLGPVVWSAPPGPALLLERPAGPWPVDSGRNHGLKFRGYRLEPDGSPVFLWELRSAATPADEPPQPGAVEIEESFVPDARPEVLFVRTLKVSGIPRGASIFAPPFGEKAPTITCSNVDAVLRPSDGAATVLELTPRDAAQPLLLRIEIAP